MPKNDRLGMDFQSGWSRGPLTSRDKIFSSLGLCCRLFLNLLLFYGKSDMVPKENLSFEIFRTNFEKEWK